MNPDRIYRQYRDDALAKQYTADTYTTFVAMPFREHFSYRSRDIYHDLFQAAACRANELKKARHPFDLPRRVDDDAPIAGVVTEDIVVGILESHLFLGDLTFENPGVLLETGIAFGVKPNAQIILVTQGSFSELHFDIRNNVVMQYNARQISESVDTLAGSLIRGALAFEAECDRYVNSIKDRLTAEAIVCLNRYGALQKQGKSYSLHVDARHEHLKEVYGEEASKLAHLEAVAELLGKGLLRTEYQKGGLREGGIPRGDAYGGHATDLGWLVIERIWPELARGNDGT